MEYGEEGNNNNGNTSNLDDLLGSDDDLEFIMQVLRKKQKDEMLNAIKDEEKKERERTYKLSVRIFVFRL